jgi:hypothetical protein
MPIQILQQQDGSIRKQDPQSTAYGTNLSLGSVKLSHVWNIVTTYFMYLNALRTLIEVEVIQEMKSSLYYFPYWFQGIIMQITVDKK